MIEIFDNKLKNKSKLKKVVINILNFFLIRFKISIEKLFLLYYVNN